ncbi:MAG: GNAT family N-acetyltransferase [Bacteroidales bacterium]|nr:GNAT family N-acetyltransferase [Bacteroidales bacterium]
MKITDLNEINKAAYLSCLEEWSDEMKERGNHKECWYNKIKDKGLGVKLAETENGTVVGMVQYVPIEYAPAEGKDLYFINCIWVHGYKKGQGNFQKKGIGKNLLQAAEEDVKQKGASGLAAWGLALPFWMKASWYKKQGFVKADRQGISVLLWKPFIENATPPKWIEKKKFTPELTPGKVTISLFINGWCNAFNIVAERVKKIARELGDDVIIREYDTFEKNSMKILGKSDELFIDTKKINTGPPPSYEKLKKIVTKKVARIQKKNT